MTKSDFALLYAPLADPSTAVKMIRRWIDMNPKLSAALARNGYRRTQKNLTPRQVELLKRYLGEP